MLTKVKKLANWKLKVDIQTWDRPMWVFIQGPYLYIDITLGRLIWQVIKEWQHDRHLVGE